MRVGLVYRSMKSKACLGTRRTLARRRVEKASRLPARGRRPPSSWPPPATPESVCCSRSSCSSQTHRLHGRERLAVHLRWDCNLSSRCSRSSYRKRHRSWSRLNRAFDRKHASFRPTFFAGSSMAGPRSEGGGRTSFPWLPFSSWWWWWGRGAEISREVWHNLCRCWKLMRDEYIYIIYILIQRPALRFCPLLCASVRNRHCGEGYWRFIQHFLINKVFLIEDSIHFVEFLSLRNNVIRSTI